MDKKMNLTDNQWLGFLDKLGIGSLGQTLPRTAQFLPEGFTQSDDGVCIKTNDIPAELLPMTVRVQDGVVHLTKEKIILQMNDGSIYHLAHDGTIEGHHHTVETVAAKDESQVVHKKQTPYTDKVLHQWTFAKGGTLTFEIGSKNVIGRIQATGLRSSIDKAGAIVFWEEVDAR